MVAQRAPPGHLWKYIMRITLLGRVISRFDDVEPKITGLVQP